MTAIQFFSAATAPSIEEDGAMTMAPAPVDPAVYRTFDPKQWILGQAFKMLFKGEGDEGFSLVHAKFRPGFRLPRHSHSSDCLYYVVAGEAHMGARVLRAGDGFFVEADAPYVYSAGPEGVEVLEFRIKTAFDMNIRDHTVEQWKPLADAVNAHGAEWAAASV